MSLQIPYPVTFILSTGRTGTQFFSRYLTDSCQNTLCLHEPAPSRRFKWYSNFYLQKKISSGFIASQYYGCRKRLFRDPDFQNYVESSNFLFGLMPALDPLIHRMAVVHLVREPVSYIRSHLNKGFWTGIKGFTARHIPGWLESLDKDILRSGDPVMILAARWIYVNTIISNYEKDYPYLLLRFEDLFGKAPETAGKALNALRGFIPCTPETDPEPEKWLSKAINMSSKERCVRYPVEDKHIDYLRSQGSPLLSKYGYTL